MLPHAIGAAIPVPRLPWTHGRARLRKAVNEARERCGAWMLAGGLATLVGIWALGTLVGPLRITIVAPYIQSGTVAAGGLARLFAAFVLVLLARGQTKRRLLWIAAGFAVLGFGDLLFGYLPWLANIDKDINGSAYAWLIVRTLAGVLFVIGLVPANPPHFSRRPLLVIFAPFVPLSLALVAARDPNPPLVGTRAFLAAASRGDVAFGAFTSWYWILSLVPMALGLAAFIATVQRAQRKELNIWLMVAMLFLAASQIYSLFWPTTFSSVISTTDLFRFAFAVAVVIGGSLELRRIADERGMLLATEQERSRHLSDLTNMKSTFTRMVAHELSSPVAAIRRFTDILERSNLRPEDRTRALEALKRESAILAMLISDVHTAATLEREDTVVQLQKVPVDLLLSDATLYARSLPGNHPVSTLCRHPASVRADRERIGQVLRNLMSNAAKYSEPGSPIDVCAYHAGKTVRIEVADRGHGIRADEMRHVFEKFTRGRDQTEAQVPGLGLGLHIAQRIVEAHGSALVVESSPGIGSVFHFDLQAAR